MTVRELIQELSEFNPDLLVGIAIDSDSEGNYFKEISDIGTSAFMADGRGNLDPILVETDKEKEDLAHVIIWPI